MATKLLFREATYKFSERARVISVRMEKEKLLLILDRTIFHPQGGIVVNFAIVCKDLEGLCRRAAK